jgi:putative DNA primase/helicase
MSGQSGVGGTVSTFPKDNLAFVQWVGRERWPEMHVAAVRGVLGIGEWEEGWPGGRAAYQLAECSAETNNYFSLSRFTGERRTETNFAAFLVLGVDDVEEKIPAEKVRQLLGTPTYRIATSVGSQQWGYVLEVPLTEGKVAAALQHAVRLALTGVEGKDPGMEALNRYFRLPYGRNTKHTHVERWGPGGCQVEPLEWTGELLAEDTVELLKLLISETPGERGARTAEGPGDFQRVVQEDRQTQGVLYWLEEFGMVLGGARNSPMGRGFDVECPFLEDHTRRGLSGTFYAPVTGAWKCWHGHCLERKGNDFRRKLSERVLEETHGLARLGFQIVLERDLPPRPLGVETVDGDAPDAASEHALALMFAETFADQAAFNSNTGKWILRQDERWQVDERNLALWHSRGLIAGFRATLEGTQMRPLGKISTAVAVLKGAASDPRLATTSADWDQESRLLGVPEGVVDLRTGVRLPGDRGLRITKQTLVAPAERGTPTPIWDAFLAKTMQGREDCIAFLHHWFGYCLSGDTSAEKIAFLYGPPRTGKGTVVNTVGLIAGDYYLPVGASVFTEQRYPAHPTEIAQLVGVRVVTGEEMPAGVRLNVPRLAEWSGNTGRVSGRFTGRDFFSFPMTGKITLIGNNKLAMGGQDGDILRSRMLVFPFFNVVALEDRDTTLKKRLETEFPGILRKLIDAGVEVYQALQSGHGLDALIPKSMRTATEDYFAEENVVALWLRVRCVADPKGRVPQAYDDHCRWCQDEGYTAFHLPNKFTAEVERTALRMGMSVRALHAKSGIVLCGIRLKR